MAYGDGGATDFNTVAFAVTLPTLAVIFAVLNVIKKSDKSKEKPAKVANTQIIVYIIIAIVMLYCAQYTNTLAAGILHTAVLFPLSYAIGMPLTMLTDTLVFRERVKIRVLCGVLLSILAALLCNL